MLNFDVSMAGVRVRSTKAAKEVFDIVGKGYVKAIDVINQPVEFRFVSSCSRPDPPSFRFLPLVNISVGLAFMALVRFSRVH